MIPKELLARIRKIQITTTHLAEDLLAGAYLSAFKGQGMEFEEVRAYQTGDDIRTIDWNVTARMQHPYVKTFCEERELTVMLVVDISASCRFGSKEKSKSEVIAEIGATLAFAAIKNHDKVGLLLFSDRVEAYIPPRKGVRHVLRVVRDLLVFEPKGKGTDLKTALDFLGRVQRRPVICFLISDFFCRQHPHELMLASKRHDLIAVSVNDPAEKRFPKMGLVAMQDLESGERALVDTARGVVAGKGSREVEENLQKWRARMQKIGAGFIQVRTDRPYIDPLRKFFKTRKERR